MAALAIPAVGCESSGGDDDLDGAVGESLEQDLSAELDGPSSTGDNNGDPGSGAAVESYGEGVMDLGEGMVAFTPELRINDNPELDPDLVDRPRGQHSRTAPERDAAQARINTDAVLAAADQRGADMIYFMVNLPEPGFDFTRLAVDDDDERRARALAERKAQLEPGQKLATKQIEGLGARVVGTYWVVNSIGVEARGDQVAEILALAEVESLSLAEIDVTPGAKYDGTDTRTAVRSEAMNSLGYEGSFNGRTNSPNSNIKVGVYDVDPLNANHVGWLDWAGGPSRVAAKKLCSGSSCVASTTAATGSSNHGTRVASVAVGSIDQGQDSNFPGTGTTAQRERSWSAQEADLYYYWGDAIKGVETAIADGVDVLNMSVALSCSGPGNFVCSPTYDCGNLNNILRNGLDAGMLTLACAGNGSQGGTGSCDLWWPGYRPETIAVNALNTSNDAVAYHDTVFTSYATTGPIPIVSEGGASSTTPGVDLLAPGEVRYAYGNATNTYFDMNGCSNATPVATGALAVLREAFKDLGWLGNDARALMVNAFVLADASDGTANGESNTRVHESAGFGRLHGHIPSSSDLTGPWGWGWRAVRIYDGQELSYSVWDAGPESPSVTEWKMALTWDAPDLQDVPDIVVKVVDTCAGGVTVAQDYSYALRKRLHLNNSQIANKCLEMRVRAWDVPPEGTVVYMADYFHGGSTTIH
ncbi:S8 family serine peptidase [Enhygromyxa salina]|uniref:S8 family serine peptidase n=1 Tax=Enhygromyxa salina TaxID=215803 RepID=UPI0015E6E132|nr:S8 family serine peptidase [Enhygromyxa salina]